MLIFVILKTSEPFGFLKMLTSIPVSRPKKFLWLKKVHKLGTWLKFSEKLKKN